MYYNILRNEKEDLFEILFRADCKLLDSKSQYTSESFKENCLTTQRFGWAKYSCDGNWSSENINELLPKFAQNTFFLELLVKDLIDASNHESLKYLWTVSSENSGTIRNVVAYMIELYGNEELQSAINEW